MRSVSVGWLRREHEPFRQPGGVQHGVRASEELTVHGEAGPGQGVQPHGHQVLLRRQDPHVQGIPLHRLRKVSQHLPQQSRLRARVHPAMISPTPFAMKSPNHVMSRNLKRRNLARQTINQAVGIGAKDRFGCRSCPLPPSLSLPFSRHGDFTSGHSSLGPGENCLLGRDSKGQL